MASAVQTRAPSASVMALEVVMMSVRRSDGARSRSGSRSAGRRRRPDVRTRTSAGRARRGAARCRPRGRASAPASRRTRPRSGRSPAPDRPGSTACRSRRRSRSPPAGHVVGLGRGEGAAGQGRVDCHAPESTDRARRRRRPPGEPDGRVRAWKSQRVSRCGVWLRQRGQNFESSMRSGSFRRFFGDVVALLALGAGERDLGANVAGLAGHGLSSRVVLLVGARTVVRPPR